MPLSSYKISDADINAKGVIAAPDKLTGTAAQNKAVFDRLIRESIKDLYNGLIDLLSSASGASAIGAGEITGMSSDGTVQGALESLKTVTDACQTRDEAAAALALKEDKSVTAEHFKAASYDPMRRTMTFTRESGETVEVTPQAAIEAGDGIEVSGNTVSLPQAFYDYLVEETFETPAIAEFTITDQYPCRIGEGVTVDHFSHRETYVGNITGNLTLRYENTTLLSDIAPSAAAVTIDFTAQTFTRDTAGTMTFTLSGTNARGHAFSKTASKTFYVPKFLGSSAAASVSGQDIIQNMRSAQKMPENMMLSETEYIYFVTDGTISTVKDALTGFGVPIEEAVVTEVSINGIAVNYNVYRTSNRIVAGAYRFVTS